MSQIVFPDPVFANEYGLLALGGELDLAHLSTAYRSGIYPWPSSEDSPIPWFSPDPRGILDFCDFHVSKSLAKQFKKTVFTATMNSNFKEVILNCSKVSRNNQPSTWITNTVIKGYQELFDANLAYSVEVWNEEKLVGGLYGVKINKFVSGESMFHLESSASKYALYFLVQELKKEGIEWIDTQMVTPLLSQFGGKEISRESFMNRLKKVI